ncbi:unnamed protein product [Zymoseptoria tritici ST99CH_1A5]|uniref:Uncharacterized protein n=1 Tax=Zymoseptoria tritici ST99CH_1A5 TaxID=1276529 RepID=A0A1Y6L8L3_ZYMTR|nr:unnamed protein product [Zymoseptoria tritici ST99CH_1A5]
MDDECNWDEPTIDEPGGIWCESTLQQAIRCSEKRYREFLNLPPVVETMNACNMSIGHSEHGKPIWMRFPRRLTDRDDSKNNLLVETITSNMAKLDYPKKSYGWNYKSTKQILISKKWARPGVMPAEDLTLAADISGIRSEDALNMSACVEIGVSSEGEEG